MSIQTFDLGDAVTCEGKFSKNGELIDPTEVKFLLIDPGENETIYIYGVDLQLERVSQGIYHFDVNADQVGKWMYRFKSTGNGQAAAEKFFRVRKSEFSE